MSALKAIHTIEDYGPVIRIDKHNLPDLDDLLLEALGHEETGDDWAWRNDEPTRIAEGSREARVQHFHMDPCPCGGDEHGWHLGIVSEDDDGMPLDPNLRGVWLGVWFE